MKKTDWNIAGAVGLALCLAAGLGYRVMTAPAPAEAATGAHTRASAAGPASAPRGAVPAAPLPASMASSVSTRAAEPAADDPFSTLSPRARRMAADWCGYGAREAMKDEERQAAAKGDTATTGGAPASDGEQVLDAARAHVLRHWLRTLRSRRDLRSQAIADYLAGDTPSRAHLQDLARRSTDPMVTALALQRPCKAEGCRMVDAAQWARLEPDNLAAWLVQVQAPSTSPDQLSYLIERMGKDASRHDDYLPALRQALAALASTETPGLAQGVEVDLLSGAVSGWSLQPMRPVMDRCQAASQQPVTAAHCARIARVMWDSASLIPRGLALGLARRVVPTGHAQRPDWEDRALRYDALLAVETASAGALAERLEQTPAEQVCQIGATLHAELRHRYRQGDWAYAEERLPSLGEPLEALARKTRHDRGGRSLLEEPPPPKAAAGASR